jgi:fructokinase
MPDVITLGELLIDFVSTTSGVSLKQASEFKKAAGGAPANVAVGLAKLGVSSGFMGKVGEDSFGHFLSDTLSELGVDVSNLRFSTEARTALAFVSLRRDGEREFMFYRHPSADMLFSPEEVDEAYIRTAKAFHFGSISLISEPSRSATLKAVQIASESGLLITYDPNLRLNLWSSPQAALEGMMLGWQWADVIKISEEELAFLTSKDVSSITGSWHHLETAARSFWHNRLKCMVITLGKKGCYYLTLKTSGYIQGFSVKAIDTTGAGDGFMAGLIKGLLANDTAYENEALLREVCRYANAVGAITTTQRGAIPALPTAIQVDLFLKNSST